MKLLKCFALKDLRGQMSSQSFAQEKSLKVVQIVGAKSFTSRTKLAKCLGKLVFLENM